jgi:beta-galactosidase GanA
MLSRSSLETQKLELMQAISEFKLQQATLERENFELRSNVLKNSLTNLNNTSSPYNKRYANQNSQQFAAINQKNNNTLSGSHGNLSQNMAHVNTVSIRSHSRQNTKTRRYHCPTLCVNIQK